MYTNNAYQQGTLEWLQMRQNHITATDASVILGVNPWKTPLQLYKEKTSPPIMKPLNSAMQRGVDLEPVARELFCLKTGQKFQPRVIVNDWAMASLDGLNDDGTVAVEIKCPGEKDHALAMSGKIPEYYYPQLQHQMYVTALNSVFYFSFDGIDGIAVQVFRDDEYIKKMVKEELKFYKRLKENDPPEPTDRDYIVKDDDEWKKLTESYRAISEKKKQLEFEEEEIKKKLVSLCGNVNSKGAGICLSQVTRKGNVDYASIPELKNIDLDKYRKSSTTSWRVTIEKNGE